MALALDPDRRLFVQGKTGADLLGRALADQHLPFLGGGHQAGGEVDFVAHHRVLVSQVRAHVAGKDAPGVDADALLEGIDAGRRL